MQINSEVAELAYFSIKLDALWWRRLLQPFNLLKYLIQRHLLFLGNSFATQWQLGLEVIVNILKASSDHSHLEFQ
jgi:hypothetical protein